jgi:AAA+ superfamily predicted ATPase
VTSLAEVTALVDAHVRHDHERFRAVTLQIAANIASRSERGANQLRRIIDKYQAAPRVLSGAPGLFSMPHDLASLDDMVLVPETRSLLDRIVLEWSRRLDLLEHGIDPARKFLFVGPPGCGKTMAAGALARAVGMSLFRIDLHGVISQHLGETAGKLAKVFETIRATPAVYLFDEFDALGSDRIILGDGSAAGAEMRRVVNSLLQFFEDDQSDSFIIAATNHPQVLDSAIFRRFDETLSFSPPTRDEVVVLMRRALGYATADGLDVDRVGAAVLDHSLGHADVRAALDRARKDEVIAGISVDTPSVVAALMRRVRHGAHAAEAVLARARHGAHEARP